MLHDSLNPRGSCASAKNTPMHHKYWGFFRNLKPQFLPGSTRALEPISRQLLPNRHMGTKMHRGMPSAALMNFQRRDQRIPFMHRLTILLAMVLAFTGFALAENF